MDGRAHRLGRRVGEQLVQPINIGRSQPEHFAGIVRAHNQQAAAGFGDPPIPFDPTHPVGGRL